VKLGGLVVVLAIAGSLSGAWACGSRTGVGLFDEVGIDAGGQDAMLDSSRDVAVSDAAVCVQNPEMSECCGFGPPSGGYSCEIDFGASVCGPNGWRCPSGGTLAAGCSMICMIASEAGLADAPSCPDAIDSGLQPPSCAPGGAGMTNCGPGGSGCESCCTSLEVEGGTYFRKYDIDPDSGLLSVAPDGGPTLEADPATVSNFRLDKYLVTVGRFRQFVSAWKVGYAPLPGSGKHTYLNDGNGLIAVGSDSGLAYEPGWVASDDVNIAPTDANLACDSVFHTWTATAGTRENLPINCMTWQEAYAFCIWDVGFLPSEAEWGYAAGGGGQQREYPWGSNVSATINQYAIYDCNYPNGSVGCTDMSSVAPVGTAALGAGLWGQLDLLGELFEWNLDWYANAFVDPCTECAYLTLTSFRVIRGIPFNAQSVSGSPIRGQSLPVERDPVHGLRCARSP
jgi:formylglycine-generating enzyme required for sulfatase activity